MADLSRTDLQALFQAVPGLYLVLTPKLKIVAASDAYLRATMTVRENIVGRHIFDVFPGTPDDPHATGVANLRASFGRVVQFRRPDAVAIQKYDVRRPDGTFEERHWSPLNIPILDDKGMVKWIIHCVEDVTKAVRHDNGVAERDAIGRDQNLLIQQLRRTNEELLRQQSMILEREAHLRSILETAPDAIITIDVEGTIQSFSISAERMFGYLAGEVIGRNVKMLMPSPYREAHGGYLERYLATGERHIIGIGRRVMAQKKDGTDFPMWLAVGEVKTDQSHFFVGFIHDLTIRAKIEEDLRQVQKMEAVGQLTGGLAHDFNNLLTVISGNLEILERRLSTSDDRVLLREAQEATELGAHLSHRLLAFARRQALNPKLTNVSELVAGTIDLLRRTLGASVEIETRLAGDLPMTLVDPGQVENALLNLAINARDAMPNGGKLTIETALTSIEAGATTNDPDIAPGTYVSLTIADTGSGMTPEVLGRAFDPFFTTKEGGAGTGLGLSMVYGFVKQSGGYVSIKSDLGYGTSVRIYLPIDKSKTLEMGKVNEPAKEPKGKGERVLVVEDQDRVRRLSVRRLKDLGYVVLAAENGPAALALLDQGKQVDLLFTDIVMPGGLSGLDLAQKARARLPNLKVLFTSGFTEPDKLREGALADNAGWIGKPYKTAQLQAKLRELLGH